jgi:hypothetical protein
MNKAMKRQVYYLIILTLILGGCTKMRIEDFNNTKPAFNLEDYFQGKTRAWGMFEDRFGRIQRQFVVDIEGTWDGKNLTLTEDFLYNDGETETRVWVLEKTGPQNYTGTTANVIGTAIGTINGNAFNWKYKFKLKVGDGYWNVKFDDWMILQPDGVLINKATITRWGFKLGTVYISFSKPANQQTNAFELTSAASQESAMSHRLAALNPNGLYAN